MLVRSLIFVGLIAIADFGCAAARDCCADAPSSPESIYYVKVGRGEYFPIPTKYFLFNGLEGSRSRVLEYRSPIARAIGDLKAFDLPQGVIRIEKRSDYDGEFEDYTLIENGTCLGFSFAIYEPNAPTVEDYQLTILESRTFFVSIIDTDRSLWRTLLARYVGDRKSTESDQCLSIEAE